MSESIQKGANPKISLIINCTLEILRDEGEQGLSLRKVASNAGMSLGNLQYYFRNKNELLAGLAEVYFERCSQDFSESLAARAPQGKRETIEFFVDYGLDYASSETGKVFRELWGMVDRNEHIRERMHQYYKVYVESIEEMLAPFGKAPEVAAKVATLLVPYLDGYGLISYPMPTDRPELTRMLVGMVEAILAGEFDKD